tara:strand:- start:4158 stop:4595 length:438 start_codon:yes stop_codon:yes gene_type:complete
MSASRFTLGASSAMNNIGGMVSPTPEIDNSFAASIGTAGQMNSGSAQRAQSMQQSALTSQSQNMADAERDMDMARLGDAQQQEKAMQFASDYKALALESNNMGDKLAFVGDVMNSPDGSEFMNLITTNQALGKLDPSLVAYYAKG